MYSLKTLKTIDPDLKEMKPPFIAGRICFHIVNGVLSKSCSGVSDIERLKDDEALVEQLI